MFFPGDESKEDKGTEDMVQQEHTQLADCEDLDPKTEQDTNPAGKDQPRPGQGNVRFASEDEEIDPLDETRRLSEAAGARDEELSPEAHEQIRSLAMSLQKSRLQENRMANFAYETVSMPPSRVCGFLSFLSGVLSALTTTTRFPREIVRRRALHVVQSNMAMARYPQLSNPLP